MIITGTLDRDLTVTDMQELSALAAERGDPFHWIYWSSRSHGDNHAQAWAEAKAKTEGATR